MKLDPASYECYEYRRINSSGKIGFDQKTLELICRFLSALEEVEYVGESVVEITIYAYDKSIIRRRLPLQVLEQEEPDLARRLFRKPPEPFGWMDGEEAMRISLEKRSKEEPRD